MIFLVFIAIVRQRQSTARRAIRFSRASAKEIVYIFSLTYQANEQLANQVCTSEN
jgi:hypothetical protein